MKKFLIGLLVVVGIGVAGLKIADAVIMGGDDYYVQITTNGEKIVQKDEQNQDVITYQYNLSGFNKEGAKKELEFQGMQARPLRKNAYLKVVWNKNKGVTGYEEVEKSAIPKAAQEKLTKG
ncbi:YxeA family protein [Enterococcus sp. DIV0660C]|uniref:YxeA family protein n=1 Tax=Enterococcus sp. DIV0660C TaxID=2230880 RepID=UPI001A8E3C88|nr:YxeA family protein [Enterococcus sp. DIV0660C]